MLFLTADHARAVPTSIRPYDPDDVRHVQLALDLMNNIREFPEETIAFSAFGIGMSQGDIEEL